VPIVGPKTAEIEKARSLAPGHVDARISKVTRSSDSRATA
jgi:hypothetical protein